MSSCADDTPMRENYELVVMHQPGLRSKTLGTQSSETDAR
jgi:hypothetical protein